MADLDGVDIWVGARTIWGEARGEGPEGMTAVAFVLLNRLANGSWGPKLPSVCLFPYQFSCWLPQDPNLKHILGLAPDDPFLLQAENLLLSAAQDGSVDPTKGALYYVANWLLRTNPPIWTAGKVQTATIGNQTFYK